jgi:hypothetical protein
MFGSSQDRARQLAGRNRRERISSCTSSRSISSSSQAPQQSPTSILESKVPSAIEEHPSCEHDGDGLALALAQVNSGQQDENATPLFSASQFASGLPGPQAEQQCLQAEHLSQVLYSSLASSASANPPQSQFSATRHTRYGSLGSIPVPHALRGAASEYQLRPQTVVSMRGGSGGYDGRITDKQVAALREHCSTYWDLWNAHKARNPDDKTPYKQAILERLQELVRSQTPIIPANLVQAFEKFVRFHSDMAYNTPRRHPRSHIA